MTNNSIFTRVLALIVCFVMVIGTFTACFNGTDVNDGVGAGTTPDTNSSTTTTTNNGTMGDSAEKEPEEDPADPNEIFSAFASIDETLIYGALASSVIIGDITSVGAIVPADVKIENGAQTLSLSIKNVEENDESFADYEIAHSLDVHVAGISADNTVPMIVNLGAVLEAGLDATSLKLYHTENGTAVLMTRVDSLNDFAIHNQYYYNAETGEVSIYVASFSVFTAVQTTASKWEEGTVADTSWYNENDTEFTLEDVADFLGFRDLVDEGNTFEGKTVTLATDIDLDNKLFNPIGGGWAYNGGKTFNGTFDGGNHTIYNIRVNGWELDETGDKHSGTSMGAGLFSSLHNATIRNLAVVGANLVVETTSIGIIAGCAQGKCTFENIVVSNATLGNYQMRNGGIVGDIYVIASDNVPENEYSHTFTNIVVDSTVKLSSMWGDFDTGNGGVIGGKYGSSKVLMQNVIVAAELDVFSDVTAAYQWYAYRRCGMLVGYTGQNSPKQATNAAADFLTCENVSVYYGDWTNYTYYQFADQTDEQGNRLWNSNYPWVRAQASDYNGPFSNVRYGNPIVGGVKINTIELADANKTGFAAITFNQLYGGGQGVYGTNEHAGVTINNDLESSKTIFILNNQNWENLKLQYWFRNGEDTWTTNIDGIDMSAMYLSSYNVYKVELPAYVDGFRIVADGENEVEFTLANLTDGETYTVGGDTHEHNFEESNKCECGAYKIQKWELVTDVNNLKVDDKIIIVAADANYAISTNQATNNRTGFAVVKNADGTITITDNVQVITLVAGTTDGTWGLYTGTGYLYAATAGSNHLKTQDTNNVNGDWTITITDGVASVVAKGSSNRNVMQYNPNNNSPIFSCYASASQKPMAIYKLSASEEIMGAHDCGEYAVGETCEGNATCTICGEVIENSALGHNYESVATDATCTKGGYTTHTCSRCGDNYVTDETDALGHNFDGDACSRCGEAKPTVGGTKTYTFSNYTAGTQYGKNEEHVLDENTIILTNNCHFTTELRIYSSSTYNGYAIIKSTNPIISIDFNAGDNTDTLVIYGSNDGGATWTEAAKVDVKSSYADYTVELSTAYIWIKLDVYGSNQVRLKSITLTTGEPCEHTNTTTTTVDATCTEAGSTTVTCDDCGTTVSTETIPATGHTFVDGVCDCGATKPTEPTPDPEPDQPEAPITASVSKSHTDIATIAGVTAGQTTGKIDGQKIKLDDYIFIRCDKGSAGTVPTIYSESIRLYQGGATLTISSAEGYIIKTVKIIVANVSAGKGPISVEGGTASELTDLVYTITANAGVSEIVITTTGTSSSTRLYVANIEVEYTTVSGSEGGETPNPETPVCTHENTTTTTVDATCTEAGSTTVTCDDCDEVIRTETIEALGHTFENGSCSNCGEEDPNYEGGSSEGGDIPTEPTVVATFTFGVNGSASHADGSSKTSYSETVGNYTLSLTNGTNMYTGARDAKGNSCIKLGASSKIASFSFTVPDDVTKVTIYVAGYKAKTVTVSVNGTTQAITTLSDNGEYTAIEIDTSTNKTVTFETTSTGYRAMVNTIEFYGISR